MTGDGDIRGRRTSSNWEITDRNLIELIGPFAVLDLHCVTPCSASGDVPYTDLVVN